MDKEERELTHFDSRGNARMVDVSGKSPTERSAVAEGTIRVSREVFDAIEGKKLKKGDVLTVSLIPMCHLLNLTEAKLCFQLKPESCSILALCTVRCEGKTGVEMEALSGVSIALLTIYDMCKALDKRMVIENIHLLEKRGGKSGSFFFSEDSPHSDEE